MPSATGGTLSNAGKWDDWHRNVAVPEPYGDTATYRLGAEWLADCALVEDWGCGKGWLSTLIPAGRYRGIDGSRSPFAAEIVDLAEYRSAVAGLFMRHVLEHDFCWRQVLANALDSFTARMVLVLFTPLGDATRDLRWEDPPGVPNLSFKQSDLTNPMDARDLSWTVQRLVTQTVYGVETMFRLER